MTGADDLRHVMKTLLNVPSGREHKIDCFVHEGIFDVQMRNILIILLALYYPGGQACELIVHLWYSASIPLGMYVLITDKILPLIKAFLESTNECRSGARLCKTKFSKSSILTIMSKAELQEFYDRLHPRNFKDVAVTDRKQWNHMHTIEPDILRKRNAYLESLPPWLKVTEEMYSHTGMLLPFGTRVPFVRVTNP